MFWEVFYKTKLVQEHEERYEASTSKPLNFYISLILFSFWFFLCFSFSNHIFVVEEIVVIKWRNEDGFQLQRFQMRLKENNGFFLFNATCKVKNVCYSFGKIANLAPLVVFNFDFSLSLNLFMDLVPLLYLITQFWSLSLDLDIDH